MPPNGDPPSGFADVEAIYDALDAQDPAAALQLARQALDAEEGEDPVLRFLAGVALIELDRSAEAVTELERAVELDTDDAEFRAALAGALLRSCRLDEAEREARSALSADPELPDAHFVRALIFERRGKDREADEQYRRAAELDSERFPEPVRISREAFEEHVARAIDRLPEAYRRHLDEVAVTVEDLPSDAILQEDDPPFDPADLLGLFVGVSRDRRSSLSPGGELPPRILLFKKNLERMALEVDELVEEIAVTLYHELGHFLGLDEEDLERIDLA